MVKWTKKDIQQLKRLCKQGKKTREIADITDRTIGAVAAKINTLQQRGEIPYKHKGKKSAIDVIKEKKVKKKKDLFPGWGQRPMPDPYSQRMKSNFPSQLSNPLEESTQSKITKTLLEIGDFLLEKNKQYGDSALQPIRIFSKADKTEQLKVRIDDKLNRLVQGNDKIEADEDVIKDLIGYFLLLLIQMRD